MKSIDTSISPLTIPALAGTSAILGPLLDNYHSQFGVLAYKNPIRLHAEFPDGIIVDFTTAPFTSPLFVVAGLIIGLGTLYINRRYKVEGFVQGPIAFPRAYATIAAFSSIYYLSAALPLTTASAYVGPILSVLAILEWYILDRSIGGLTMGALTAIAGPVVEMVLINWGDLYSYAMPEMLGIPLFIAPVYFAGGPAVGNLARALQK